MYSSHILVSSFLTKSSGHSDKHSPSDKYRPSSHDVQELGSSSAEHSLHVLSHDDASLHSKGYSQSMILQVASEYVYVLI